MANNYDFDCELLTIGNELLIGRTVNTNSTWISKRITTVGGVVTRCVTILDELTDISQAIREALARHPRWLILCGGLGPTFDDKTMEGLANALGRPLEVNKEVVRVIDRKYSKMQMRGLISKVEMTPARIKMATLPEGSLPLSNPIGTAPGVLLSLQHTLVFALPGVPSEMKRIFLKWIEPVIQKEIGDVHRTSKTLLVRGVLESTLAPLLDDILSNSDSVYIKSHPKGIENGRSKLEIEIATSFSIASEAEERVTRISDRLSRMIDEIGGKVSVVGDEK